RRWHRHLRGLLSSVLLRTVWSTPSSLPVPVRPVSFPLSVLGWLVVSRRLSAWASASPSALPRGWRI
ncbi:hypothetical protein FOL46_002743, partial [Perkinsus olseni]